MPIIYQIRTFVEGEEQFSRTQVRKILEIGSKNTLAGYLETLGINNKLKLTWADMEEILQLRLFLASHYGGTSREMYSYLKENGQLGSYLQQKHIDPTQALAKVQAKYYRSLGLNADGRSRG